MSQKWNATSWSSASRGRQLPSKPPTRRSHIGSGIRMLVLARLIMALGACVDSGDSAPLGVANADASAATTPGASGASGGTGSGVTSTGSSGASGSTSGEYTVGGSASGILGSGLILQLNGGPGLPLTANGAFTFSNALPNGSSYLVTIAAQPSNPSQTCVLGGATGAVASSAITTVLVTCTSAPIQFAYGGNHAGIYCFAVTAIGSALVPLAEPQCDSGDLPMVAVDPAGPFVYATDNSGSPPPGSIVAPAGHVRMYRIDSTTGRLVPLSTVEAEPPTAPGPIPIGVDPTGHFVYVGSENSVSAYAIDPTSGLLTPLTGSPFAAGGGYADELAIEPTGRFLYTTNTTTNNVSAFAIDATTGSLTPTPGSPFPTGDAPTAIAVDPLSRYVFVGSLLSADVSVFSSDVSVFIIDSATGALSPALGSPFTIPCPATSLVTVNSLAVDASGAFLFVASSCGLLASFADNVDYIWGFAIDPNTGALAPVPGSPLLTVADPMPPGPNGPLYIMVQGETLYASNGNGTLSTFAIDQLTGGLTQSGSPIASGSNMALYNLTFGL
jgi:6-phosphogluconolactonase